MKEESIAQILWKILSDDFDFVPYDDGYGGIDKTFWYDSVLIEREEIEDFRDQEEDDGATTFVSLKGFMYGSESKGFHVYLRGFDHTLLLSSLMRCSIATPKPTDIVHKRNNVVLLRLFLEAE